MSNKILDDANIPESQQSNCYIASNGQIFTPQFDLSNVMTRTGEQAYNEWLISSVKNAKDTKLAEISAACEQIIYAGTDVTTTKGTEHFSATAADQTNLSALAAAVAQGATQVPYHADGQLCREFAATEFTAVYTAVKNFIAYNTTLCNHINVWIRRCATVAEISAITYASKLPDDLQTNFNAIIGITS